MLHRMTYRKLVEGHHFNAISAACLEGRPEAVEEALKAYEEANGPCVKWGDVIDEVGWSPLHFASRQSGQAIVDLLLRRGFPPLVKTLEGNTPLHLASQSGRVEVVRRLLDASSESATSLECKNSSGNTPLHVACQERHVMVVKELLESSAPTPVSCSCNDDGATPLGLAILNSDWESARLLIHHSPENPALFFADLASHVPACSEMKTLHDNPLNVFVMGDANSGKSTFVRTLQSEGMASRLASTVMVAMFGVQHVDQHRVGVIPTVAEFTMGRAGQKHQVVFYDLAGHRDYTHEAMFEGIHKPLKSLFVVTVDMRDDDAEIERKILYWINFIWQKCSRYSSQAKPNVLVLGTFADKCTRAYHKLNLICRSIPEKTKEHLMSHFTWLGNLTVNCRWTYSWGMYQFRSVLSNLCQQQEKETHTPSECYLLGSLVLTEQKFAREHVVSVGKVIECVLTGDNTLCKLLPQKEAELVELGHMLHRFSCIRLLSCSDTHYIIPDYRNFLNEVHEKLSMPSLHQSVNHGILRLDSMTKVFYSFPHDFIIEFLESFKFCEGVPPVSLLKLRKSISDSRHSLKFTSHSSESSLRLTRPTHHRTRSTASAQDVPSAAAIHLPAGRSHSQPGDLDMMAPREPSPDIHPRMKNHRPPPFYFFPIFIPQTPPDPWENNDTYTYSFAWILEGAQGQEHQHFLPHFVTVLLFCFSHSFAPPPTNATSILETRCNIWDCGVTWMDLRGIEVCVSIHNNRSIVISMRCVRKAEMECLQLRNQIMDHIYNLKDRLHPETQIVEFLVPGDGNTVFPVCDPSQVPPQSCYSKEEIRRAVLEHYPVVCNLDGKEPKELDTLLYFEPSCVLDQPLREQLLSGSNEPLSDDFCVCFAKQLGHWWKHLAQYYELPDAYVSDIEEDKQAAYRTGIEMLRHLRDSVDHGVHTYQDLRESLQSISIFKYDNKVSTVAL